MVTDLNLTGLKLRGQQQKMPLAAGLQLKGPKLKCRQLKGLK